uniref:FAS1 domain-containing protein n=1 Tax=Steinernema glaseri TaxID=37863 RepID=A0A1I8AJB4_9BILA
MIQLALLLLYCLGASADLWAETARMSDLQQWRTLTGRYQVAQAYMQDSNAKITVFAPVNDVFLYNPDLRAMDQKETLSHICDTQIFEIGQGKRWEKQTLIRSTINSGYMYITQFESNPGNYSYFANAGRICNHASNQWGMISGEQYLYKTCTPMGHRPYPGSALSLLRDSDKQTFEERHYDNRDLTEVRDILDRIPDIALVIFGSSAWNGFHTFFIPNNNAFAKVVDRMRIDREVLLAHVTGINRVLFTYPWLYDGGQHYYPSVWFSANIIEDNFKQKLTMKNITDRRTGKWDHREVLLAHVTGINRVLFTYPWLYDGGQHYYPSVWFSANIIEDNFKQKLTMKNITDRRTGKWDCKSFLFSFYTARYNDMATLNFARFS